MDSSNSSPRFRLPPWPPFDPDVAEVLAKMSADGSYGNYAGEYGERLEQMLGEQFDSPFVWTCASGTIAVELALRGLGIGPGDEVILAAYDFAGNFRAIEAVGARPVLVDIVPHSWCLSLDSVHEALAPNTKAVLFSHLHGGLAPARELRQWADDHRISLVEDVCQAPGAMVDGKPAGTWGDVSTLSFGGSKLLSAGRGGAVLTARQDVFQRVKIFAERGNNAFPLSELQAAVLLPQLRKLPQRNALRRANVERLLARLRDVRELQPARRDVARPGCEPAYYKVPWLWRPEGDERDDTFPGRQGTSRDHFIPRARHHGVPIDVGFRGFAARTSQRCRKVGTLVHSRIAAERTLLLHHPVLLEDAAAIDQLADAISAVVRSLEMSDSPE